MSYATLDEARKHTRYDDSSNDENLVIYLETATAIINRLITDDVANDTTGEMVKALRNCSLILVGWFDDQRNGDDGKYVIDPIFGLPNSAAMIIKLYRTPTAI